MGYIGGGRPFVSPAQHVVRAASSTSKGGNSAAWWFSPDGAVDLDPATQNRLRTAQMLRAVRDMAGLAHAPPRPPVGVTGEVLDAEDCGGDDARLIDQAYIFAR